MKQLGFVLLLGVLTPASAFCQDGSEANAWISSAVEMSLEYHCRIKFGDSAETLTPNPDKLAEKWTEMDKLLRTAKDAPAPAGWKHRRTGKPLNEEIVLYFENVQKWEKWVRTKNDAFERRMGFFLLRVVGEELGGQAVRDIYDAMPDRFEEKQDLGKIVGDRLGQTLKDGMLQHALEIIRLELVSELKAQPGNQASAAAAQLVRLGRKPIYEKAWLTKHRPGLLDKSFVESRKKLLLIKDRVASRATPEKLKLISSCPQVLCRQFAADHALAAYFEKEAMPQLAIAPAERWTASLDLAYREALQWNARESGGSSDPTAQMADLLRTTNRVFTPRLSSRGEPFDYVNPADPALLNKQQKLVDLRKSYIGFKDAPEPIQDLNIVDDVLVALGKTGIATYNIATGERIHLMYDLGARESMESMAIPKNGDYVYAITSESKAIRYDLKTGKRDESFKAPEVQRKDDLMAISPDGKWMALVHLSKIHVYDIVNGVKLGESRGPLNLLMYGIEFSSNGRSLLVHGNGPVTTEYPLPNGSLRERRISEVNENGLYVYSVRFEHNALIAGGRGAITIWPEDSTKPLFATRLNVNGNQDHVDWASITPDRQFVISSHGVWNISTGELQWRFAPTWNTKAMALTKDGRRFIAAGSSKIFFMPTCVPVKSADVQDKPEMRTWVSGKYRIEATFVEMVGDRARLQRADGQTTDVPINILSPADQKYLRELGN